MRVSRYGSVSKCCAFLFLSAALGATAVWVVGIRPAPLVADEPRAASKAQEKECLELLHEVQRLRAEVQRLNDELNRLSQKANHLARAVLTRDDGKVAPKASVDDKYSHLLRKIAVPEDVQSYSDFCDWGYWSGTSWRGHTNLPPGYWVYVFPHWYIWGDCQGKPQQ